MLDYELVARLAVLEKEIKPKASIECLASESKWSKEENEQFIVYNLLWKCRKNITYVINLFIKGKKKKREGNRWPVWSEVGPPSDVPT